jgi:hypothetical protein
LNDESAPEPGVRLYDGGAILNIFINIFGWRSKDNRLRSIFPDCMLAYHNTGKQDSEI